MERLLAVSLLLMASMTLSSVTMAQGVGGTDEVGPLEPLPLPADWRERSGIDVGLQIKEMSARSGEPFDANLINVRERPVIGLDVVRRGRNLLVLEDTDGSVQRATFGGQRGWQEILQVVYSLYPDRFDMVMALTTWQERTAAAYYLPLSNETRGIGYLHLTGRDVFNSTGSNLDGLIFMNDYRFYLGRNSVYGRVVFLQEIGHRWGAFVYYGNGPDNGRNMLGRDDSHWSYFMDSRNSGLEGNAWRDNNNGSFTTETNAFTLTFSDLDRYLMGFLPAEQVDDWFLIRNPDVRGQRDSFGRTINPASAPSYEGRTTINGSRYNISIDDVIAAEGERRPGFDTSQKVWNVATVLILSQGTTYTDATHNTVTNMLDDWEEIFEDETGNVADLVLTLEDEPPPPERDFGEDCTSTAQCNPANSTVCLSTDDGRICSKRCSSGGECGAGFCCAESFCYPSGDSLCEAPANNEPGNNEPGNNEPGNNEPGNNAPGNDGFVDNSDGFVNDGVRGDGFVSGTGSTSGGCATAGGGHSPAGLPALALALFGFAALRRRRA